MFFAVGRAQTLGDRPWAFGWQQAGHSHSRVDRVLGLSAGTRAAPGRPLCRGGSSFGAGGGRCSPGGSFARIARRLARFRETVGAAVEHSLGRPHAARRPGDRQAAAFASPPDSWGGGHLPDRTAPALRFAGAAPLQVAVSASPSHRVGEESARSPRCSTPMAKGMGARAARSPVPDFRT